MNSFHSFLEDIYLSTNMPFIIKIDGKEVFKSIDNESLINDEIIANVVEIKNRKVSIIILKKDENCINLLKYLIKDRIKKIFDSDKNLIKKLLNGEEIDNSTLKKEIPFLKEKFYVINVYVEKDKLIESNNLIKELYLDRKIVNLIFKDSILLMGNFKEIEEHVESLRESIESNMYLKCYIAYKKVNDFQELRDAFFINKYKINLSIKYNLEKYILGEKDLIFESVIDKVDKNFKIRILDDIKLDFSKLDDELIRTIDILYKSDINLSKASKMLYIHRNTLIYRIEKIEKITSFDLRNFNDSVIFKILFCIYKEYNRSKIDM